MKREYEEAFVEVDEIIKIMPVDISKKIPVQFRKIISENKAKDYNVKIQEPLNEKNLKKETVVILGLIYRDFLVSPEEREQLKLKDVEELKRIEQEMQQQYDINNVFEKRKASRKVEEHNEEQEYSTSLVLYEEPGFLKKFFNLIKGIFKRNKN